MLKSLLLVVGLLAAVVYCEDSSASNTAEEFKKWRTREHASTADRDKLLDDLFGSYKKHNYPENSTVKFGLNLLNADFCDEKDLMHSNVWIRMMWDDSRLTWDEKERGVSVLRVPSDKLWVPDMTLYNGVKPTMDCALTNALIYPTGKVLVVPPCRLSSYCNLTLAGHPDEEQVCTLKFGSWTFDGFTMGLEFFDPKEQQTDVSHFYSQKWKVTKNEAIKEEKYYDCCVEPYLDIKYTLGFKRRSQVEQFCKN